ncbi:MAG: RHS repeat-associated core domain-containing protein [Gemmatimonadaceae bacterium]
MVSFGYDGAGRRVRKSVGSIVYKYVYDGDQILTIDSLGTRVRTYSYYPGVDRPHSVITNVGARYYYVSEIGATSVVGIVDTTGAIFNRYQHSPFGASEAAKDSIVNPFKYTGREYDPETQLYFYRARYYDPSLARFVSEDSIGQNGGANQYSYANDNPINTNDPSGMLSAELMESYYQMVCARAPKTDSSCHWGGGGGGGAFGDINGAVSLG